MKLRDPITSTLGLLLLTCGLVLLAASASANNAPNPPTFEDPLNGETGEWLCTVLRWGGTDPDGDAVRFDVYWGATSPPPLVSSNQTSDIYFMPGLTPSTTYYWRIVVRDSHGAETSGDEWYFTTKSTNSPPTVPNSPQPANNAGNQLVTTSLEWVSVDHDGGCDLTYYVYFGTNPSPPYVATLVDETTYYPGPLAFLTTYYWRIIARDHLGVEIGGPTWSFTTKENTAPNAPSQPHPLNGGAGSTNTLLTWTGTDIDAQPLQYLVYFGPNTPPPLVASNISNPSYDPGPLQPGVTYYWQVLAFDGALYMGSPLWSFVARIPGDVVNDNMLTPADAACALQIYLVNPGCGGPNPYLMADANCDGNVTPGDARCIHREALGLGCDICEDAVAPAPPQELTVFPEISLSSWMIENGTLVLRLAVSGVNQLNAFGLYTWTWPRVPVLSAETRGASSHFDEWHSGAVSQYIFVGGYSLADQPLGANAEFVELHYDVSGGMPDAIAIDGFVDDLGGANQVYLDLDTMVGTPPIPTTLALHQNYPNPFNPLTTIAYDLPVAHGNELVRLQIVDVTGRVVRTLVDEDEPGGRYQTAWDGKDERGQRVASGIYFSVLDARGNRQTRKLVFLK